MEGARAEKCAVCNKLVTHCCMHCSAEPNTVGILPLHKEKYQKKGTVVTFQGAVPRRAPEDISKNTRSCPAFSRHWGKRPARPDDGDAG
eukprot:1449491-Pleurochrysis_carterae.AAC.6